MNKKHTLIITLFLTIYILSPLNVLNSSADQNILFREDFNDLSNWSPFLFKKIERHSQYNIIKDSEISYLKASTNNSASGLVYNETFNVKDFPILNWRWKITKVFQKGNALKKKGDDYPIRIYVNFLYDPDKASFTQRMKYSAAKAIYGKYPPHSAISYIWSNKIQDKRIITSSYTDESKMIIMDSGNDQAGVWVEHEVNILEDYREAFGEEPPLKAVIAVMSDSDNTGESTESFIDYIEVEKVK